jgi:TP901 family phage tail tape measure protein
MSGLLPPVVATLIADTKEYMAKMTEAQAKMGEFGAASKSSAGLFGLSAKTIAFGAAGVAAAVGTYAVDAALKFNEQMDKVKLQAGLTKEQTDQLGQSILNISSSLGVTTSDLATGAVTIEQAGIKGAAATTLLNNAAKASIITNASVADTTKAIVAAQTLQVTKGMDVAKLTGILVKGSQDFVGGLASEEQMLQGRVGVALAKYGLSLQTIIPLGAEFAKVGLPTRSIASFANALGNLQKPLTDSKGKLTSYAQGLERVGLSQANLAKDLRVGNITGILDQIKQAAQESGQPLSAITQTVFGSTGAGTASVLIKNLNDLAAAQKNLTGAGGKSLAQQTQQALMTPAQQIKVFQQSLNAAMVNLGTVALPWVITGVKFATGVLETLTGLITGNYKGRTAATGGKGQAVKDVLGSIWNAFDQEATSLVKTVVGGLTFNDVAASNAFWKTTSMPFAYHPSTVIKPQGKTTVNLTLHSRQSGSNR